MRMLTASVIPYMSLLRDLDSWVRHWSIETGFLSLAGGLSRGICFCGKCGVASSKRDHSPLVSTRHERYNVVDRCLSFSRFLQSDSIVQMLLGVFGVCLA